MTAIQASLEHPHLHINIDPNTRISTFSRWDDAVWYIDNATAGSRKSGTGLRWDFKVNEQEVFTAPQHAALLDIMRRLIWSLLHDNRHGRNLKPSSIITTGIGVRFIARWMIKHRINSLNHLTPDVCQVIRNDLVANSYQTINGRTQKSVFFYSISLLTYLFQQRDIYLEAGLPAMPAAPFGDTSIRKLDERTFPKKRIKEITEMEIPKEVSLPTLIAAQQFLDVPAHDILCLQNKLLSWMKGRDRDNSRSEHSSLYAVLQAYQFGKLPNKKDAWHAPLLETQIRVSMHKHVRERKPELNLSPVQLLMQLTKELIGALLIVIQAGTGMRANEVAGLKGGIDPSTGWPSCIKVRSSKSGLSEIFYISGRLYKTVAMFQETEWVCGMRPKGSSYVPPVVKAIQKAEEILAPWRARTTHEELFTFPHGTPGVVWSDSTIMPILVPMFRTYQRSFVRNFVKIDWSNLPDTPQAEPFRLLEVEALKQRQWRKTWAKFMFSMDLTAAPSISQQFKHIGLAMAEEGYIGNDPGLQSAALEAILDNTVDTLADIAHGREIMTGGLSKLIRDHISSLTSLTENKDEASARSNVAAFVVDHDLRLWFQDHGECGIALKPLEALCHKVAGTVTATAIQPNWSTQQPSLCVGCSCWLTTGKHAPFWLNRYATNRVAEIAHQGLLPSGEARLFERRAFQAKAILRALNISIPTDEACHVLSTS